MLIYGLLHVIGTVRWYIADRSIGVSGMLHNDRLFSVIFVIVHISDCKNNSVMIYKPSLLLWNFQQRTDIVAV